MNINELHIEPELIRLTDTLQIPYSFLLSKSRARAIIRLRYCIWYYLVNSKHISYWSIGQYFNKDYTTVLYGVIMASFRIANWDDYKSTYKTVKSFFETL